MTCATFSRRFSLLFAAFFTAPVSYFMKKLLSAPLKMALSELDNNYYQQILKQSQEVILNLMAVKVENLPDNFLNWLLALHDICKNKINFDLLNPEQLPIVKKLQVTLEKAISVNQLKMLRITPWPIFADTIQQLGGKIALEERLALLRYVEEIKNTPLQEMTGHDRLAIAGKHTADHDVDIYQFDVEWFASTKGASYFHQIFAQRPNEFDAALNLIPAEGEINEPDYQAFVKSYQAIFKTDLDGNASSEKAPLMPATRLLAMKRPDQFVALTNQKQDVLAQALGFGRLSNTDFDGYWNEVIELVRTCNWWRQAAPEDAAELELWNNRAIFIDAFYFADDDTAQNSNFVKAKERKLKPKPTRANSGVGRKRTKETAEQIVGRRLEDETLPDFLRKHRNSLVTEVEKGKTVDEAIKLFTSIFG